jgi:hypothetical protein
VPGEARGAAGLRVHHRRLGVGRRCQHEDEARDHERHRREAEREGRHHAERVVDRRADVPVGGREERPHAVDAGQRLVPGYAPSQGRSLERENARPGR